MNISLSAMYPKNKLALISTLALLQLSTSCKKGTNTGTAIRNQPVTTTTTVPTSPPCKTTLYGYTTTANSTYDSISNCKFGIVNSAKATISELGKFTSSLILNNAAFNSQDNCYYTFTTSANWAGSDRSAAPLYRIATNGSVTALENSDSKSRYTGITYNRITRKLYCMKKDSIVEITVLGNVFYTTNLVKTSYPFARSFTTDVSTGDIYYVTIDTPASIFHIERYRPGTNAPVSIATGSGSTFNVNPSNLCYNENDHLLYGTSATIPKGFYFLKIDPNTGTIERIGYHNFYLNPFFTSACIDPCNNRYVLSTILDHWGVKPLSCILLQLSMTGEAIQTDTTTTFFTGLTVK